MFNLQWTAWASTSWFHDDRNRMLFIECGFEISSAGLQKARFPIKITFSKNRIFVFFEILAFLRKYIVDVRDHVSYMFVKTNSHVRSNWSEYANLFVSVRIGSYLFGSVQICTNRVYSVVSGTLSDDRFGDWSVFFLSANQISDQPNIDAYFWTTNFSYIWSHVFVLNDCDNFHATKCFDFHHLELIVIENDSLSHGKYHVRNPDANEYHVINYHVSDSGTSMFARPRFCFLFLDFNQIHYKLTVLNRTMRNIIQITPLLCFKL